MLTINCVKIMLGLYVNDSGIFNTNIYEYLYIDNIDNGWLIMVAWFCFAFWFQADCISYHQPKARASEARNPSWSCRKSSALLRSKITLDISGCHWNSAIWQNSVRYCKQINMKGWSSWSTASNMFTSDFLSYPLSPLCFVPIPVTLVARQSRQVECRLQT